MKSIAIEISTLYTANGSKHNITRRLSYHNNYYVKHYRFKTKQAIAVMMPHITSQGTIIRQNKTDPICNELFIEVTLYKTKLIQKGHYSIMKLTS